MPDNHMDGPDGRINIGKNASEHTMTTARTGLENSVDSHNIKGMITCTKRMLQISRQKKMRGDVLRVFIKVEGPTVATFLLLSSTVGPHFEVKSSFVNK